MTIKELKDQLESSIMAEKERSKEAVCKYGEGLHEGHALGLQEALFYVTLLEGYHEAGSN